MQNPPLRFVADEADAGPGPWLRRLRAEAGLTQQEVAERSGLSVRMISNLERGRTRKPYPSSIRRLAAALGHPGPGGDEMTARQRGLAGRPPPAGHAGGVPPQRDDLLPRQLPAGVRRFVGRADELGRLSALLEEPTDAGSAVTIVAIGGMAGVGKTALAVHWAHQVAGRFPDGQMYLNLRGFDPSGRPVPPGEAIRGFLDALRVPAERIPADPDAQTGLYRSLVAGRRMLVLLDNARDNDQVRPLLPGSPGCVVLVTSRGPLTGLVAAEDAYPVSLDVLSAAEAGELLGYRLGARQAAAEPAAISELAGLCGRLPLALSVVAAKVTASPGRSLAALTAELRDARRRLDVLETADTATAVRAVFSWSCRRLGEPAARTFRLLGIHPGPDISLPAAASLTGLPARQVRAALDELTSAHLVSEHQPGRFAVHDLLHAYAAEQCEARDTGAERQGAAGRVLDHYLHTASHAAAALYPAAFGLALPTVTSPAPGVVPEDLADPGQPLAWLRAEHQVLIAATAWAAGRFDSHAMRIPLLLRPFLRRGGYWQDAVATGRTALAAARRLGDPAGQAHTHHALGTTYVYLRAYQDADAHLGEALALFRQLGDPRGQGTTHGSLQAMFLAQQRHADALHHAEQALGQYRAAGYREGEAFALNNVGWCHVQMGNAQQALPFLRKGLQLQRDLGSSIGVASTLDSLGYANHLLGRHRQAIDCYRRAGAIARQVADRPHQATVLVRLGDAHQAAGQTRAARHAWQQALEILTDLKDRDAERVRAKLAG